MKVIVKISYPHPLCNYITEQDHDLSLLSTGKHVVAILCHYIANIQSYFHLYKLYTHIYEVVLFVVADRVWAWSGRHVGPQDKVGWCTLQLPGGKCHRPGISVWTGIIKNAVMMIKKRRFFVNLVCVVSKTWQMAFQIEKIAQLQKS